MAMEGAQRRPCSWSNQAGEGGDAEAWQARLARSGPCRAHQESGLYKFVGSYWTVLKREYDHTFAFKPLLLLQGRCSTTGRPKNTLAIAQT